MIHRYSKLLKDIYTNRSADWEWIVENSHRCTGKTTATALRIISAAMLSPDIPVKIVEDIKHPAYPVTAPGGLTDVVKNTIDKLGLKYFVVNKTNSTLTYKVYGHVREVETVTKWEALS